MIKKYDILILSAEKDFNKLPYLYDSLVRNIEGYNNIYIVSPIEIPNKINGIIYLNDADVTKYDFAEMGMRAGWYKQQFIKLFQNITIDDYLVIDSDVYISKKIDVIEGGKPCFLLGQDQQYEPYFAFMKDVFNLERIYPYSFINEMMLFRRDIIKHMLSSINLGVDSFYNLVLSRLKEKNESSGFSEYETYGNYVSKFFPDMYNYKYLKTNMIFQFGAWSDEGIQWFIGISEKDNYDKLSIHSW